MFLLVKTRLEDDSKGGKKQNGLGGAGEPNASCSLAVELLRADDSPSPGSSTCGGETRSS